MGLPRARTQVTRETIKSVAAGLVGATVPGLASLRGAEAAVVHAMRDVAFGLAPMIFLNALMSTLIPAIVTLRRRAPGYVSARSLLTLFAGPAGIVLSLAAGGTVATIGLIHLVGFAFSLTGLAAAGIMWVRAVQAVLVAAILTPLTIALFSSRSVQD